MARSPEFVRIINAGRNRDGTRGVDTLVVSGHLAQMRMFMLRQGIEFYPRQDTYGFRKLFIENLIEACEIDARLEGIADDFLTEGKGLWMFRPVKDTYRIHWFPKEDYRVYRDATEEIEEADVRYRYSIRPGAAQLAMPGVNGMNECWVRLRIRADRIEETISLEKPEFDGAIGLISQARGRTRQIRNSLGFVPCVEAFNNMASTGFDASGDFDWLADHIVNHDQVARNIRRNIRYFGNPTLLTSRSKSDVTEKGEGSIATTRATFASQAGFSGEAKASTRVSMPTGSADWNDDHIARLITNLEPNDRLGYITPDAVSGDQNLYAKQYREEIRTALGGVDELGITAGATAFEIRSLFGRTATTAARKCRGLITYGLCKLLAMIIYNEERVFRDSFAAALKMKRPVAPVREEFVDQKKFDKALAEFQGAMGAFDAKVEAKIGEAVQAEQMPIGVIGLLPDGDPRVMWRWRGPVFEESSREILDNSIVVRNLQELGVNSIQALRHLFPDKTDEERAAMLSGYPFRMAQATQASIGTFLALIGQLRQTPHPQSPNLPLLADPRLDITPFLYRSFDYLNRELTYAGQYRDSSGPGQPATLDAVERQRAERGLPISPADRPALFVPDADSPWVTGSAWNGPLGPGVSGRVRIPDRDAELPAPGSVMATDPLRPAPGDAFAWNALAGSGWPSATGMGASSGPGPAGSGVGGPRALRPASDLTLAAATANVVEPGSGGAPAAARSRRTAGSRARGR